MPVGLRTRRARVIAAVAAALVLAFCLLTARLFVKPDLNQPVRSDAIVVLGGNAAVPTKKAISLAREGFAPNLVFSLNPFQHCASSFPDVPRVRRICFRANPASTQGEARAIAQLAGTYHWHRIIVVNPVAQATRARLRIGRCYSGQILEVGVPSAGIGGWLREIVYEWGALLKALILQPSC